jgi:hypothetical protein
VSEVDVEVTVASVPGGGLDGGGGGLVAVAFSCLVIGDAIVQAVRS